MKCENGENTDHESATATTTTTTTTTTTSSSTTSSSAVVQITSNNDTTSIFSTLASSTTASCTLTTSTSSIPPPLIIMTDLNSKSAPERIGQSTSFGDFFVDDQEQVKFNFQTYKTVFCNTTNKGYILYRYNSMKKAKEVN